MPRGIPNNPRVIGPAGGDTPTRADEVRRERRRKPGSTTLSGIKLSVDESALDRKNYHYRFVKAGDGNRINQLYGQDYDVAPEAAKPDSNSVGTVNSAHGGTGENGAPYDMVLMRKPKDWFDADQKEKQAPLDAMDEAIRRGQDHAKNELRGPGVYTPDAGNSIERA